MRNLTVALVVVIGVLGGFYSGWKYSQSRVTTTAAAAQTQAVGSSATGAGAGAAGAGGGGAAFGRGNVVAGQITAVGTGTINVHDRITNADVKVTFDATTPILKSSPGQVSDLANGATITVTGPKGTDGTVVAQGIQLGGLAGRGAG